MTTHERAEKIIHILGENGYWAYHDRSQIDVHITKITSQLDEVAAEDVADMSKSANILLEAAHEEGFAAAREQAAGIVQDGHKSSKCVDPDDCPYCCFAERIRAMKPE